MTPIQPTIFDKFTVRLKRTLFLAYNIAKNQKVDELGINHLLYGMITEQSSVASEILRKSGINPADLKNMLSFSKKILISDVKTENLGKIIGYLEMEAKTGKKLPKLSPDAKKALLSAINLAHRHSHHFVGTEHLLWAILNLNKNDVPKLFKKLGADINYIKNQINNILESTNKFADLTQMFDLSKKTKKEENLNYFCKDLSSKESQEKIEPVFGKEREINRIINILGRKTKNNPLILGEPGVGKTALVEGLAKKIYLGKVPSFLCGKRILSLDVTKIIAGTMFRGELEARLKSLIEEVEQNPNIILFIDDIHSIIGLGNSPGNLDAANILKPALASGNIRLIGTTTFDEYRKFIEGEAAFERRFQIVKIEEPTCEETIDILKGLKQNYEKFHKVRISDGAINAAVTLSTRFLPEKFLPDKALDLIDETASFVKTKKENMKVFYEILNLKKELERLYAEKKKKVLQEEYAQAMALKVKANKIACKILNLKNQIKTTNKNTWQTITATDIAQTISSITKIPVEKLVSKEKEKLLNLENILKQRIIGQDEACDIIARFIRRSRAGITSPNRPIGSFMFLGPTGVGKTELAKVIAQEVFEDEKALLRFDMSEYAEKFNASKLIGAPAGYIGYEEGGKLTEAVRKKPYSVILFDEIEKAHPDIFNLLLPILDEGFLTDARGVKINFKNTIIIMTSNTGTRSLATQEKIGFGSNKTDLASKTEILKKHKEFKEKILADLKEEFRPEFLNRIDKILVFKPLDQQSILKIVDLQLEELKTRLKNKQIKLQVTQKAKEELAKKGFNIERGARPLRNVIQEFIEDPLALSLINGEFKEGDTLKVIKGKEKFEIQKCDSARF